MDLRQLRYFQAVAEELSYSRAAVRLRIAQPALSRAVQDMEAELGAPLLARNRRKVSLTPAGKVLLRETAILFERWEEAMRRVLRAASGEEGELRLGYIGPPTHGFLGRILDEYSRRCPDVTVHLEERTPERVWEMVAKGRLHIGLTRPVLAHAALRMQTLVLRWERLCAAIPERHRWAGKTSLPWRKLAGEPLIVLARREGAGLHDEILAGCRRAGFIPRLTHTPSVISTVLRYVEAGTGIGIVPESLAELDASSRWTKAPLTPHFTVPLVMVWKEEHEEPPVAAFRQLVGEWLKAGTLWKVA